jgi:tetratricopeptide (TPR) repeat protein
MSAAMGFFNRLFGRSRQSSADEEGDPVIADLTRAIQSDPGDFLAYAHRGDAFRNRGNLDRAIGDYSSAIDCYRGRLAYMRTGRVGGAASLTDALQTSPETASACFHRGCAYACIGQLDRAITDFTELIHANPQGEYHLERALAYLKMEAYDLAIADLAEAILFNPLEPKAYQRRGVIYLAKREPDAAIVDFNRVIEQIPASTPTTTDPVYVDAYANRGTAFLMKKEYHRAISDYTSALGLEPGLALVYRDRANAYRAIGDIDNARRDEQKARELSS